MADRKRARHLKPMTRRRRQLAEQNAVIVAMEALESRAGGESALPELAHQRRASGTGRKPVDWTEPAAVADQIELAKALYQAHRIGTQQYVFYACLPIEHLHDSRIMAGHYDNELKPIDREMDLIRQREGLADDEFWPSGSGPSSYHELEARWEAVVDRYFAALLNEHGLDDLRVLYETNRTEFDRLRERGRRSAPAATQSPHLVATSKSPPLTETGSARE